MRTISNIQELDIFVKENNKIIIYGAGVVAQTLIRYCEYKHWKSKIEYMLVSEEIVEPRLLKGKNVFSMQNIVISEEEVIVIAVREKLQFEIMKMIESHGTGVIAAVSDVCSDELLEFCDKKMVKEGDALETMCQALEIRDTHLNTFSEYQNRFCDKDVAIIATGPSLNNYQPLENVINIGLNAAYKYNKLKLDYLFFQDYGGSRRFLLDDIINLPCEVFLGKYMENSMIRLYENSYFAQIPEGKIRNTRLKRYFIESPSDGEFYRDIRYYPLVGHGSVVFAALQFALFANPKKIYLVGCDCSDSGHFDSDKRTGMNTDIIYEGYLKLKSFCAWHYPDTEIISVNPVGLKGLFKDIYQDKGEM